MERGLHAELPVTEAAAARTLALPMFPALSSDDQATVVAALREAVGRHVDPALEAEHGRDTAGAIAR
jgi:dTDP-4-amino-4,6-dideoxygalactose transaminase